MIISKTPLRMSFFGGGSDLANYFENSSLGYGSVISTAVDMYIYVTVNTRRDNKIRVVYSGNELVDSVDEVQHNIIRSALKLLDINGGIEIFYSSDISISSSGLGLSSSSALTVGVLNALHTYKGELISPIELAKEAYHIERNMIGQSCGIQDQLAVSCGGFKRYRFYNDWRLTAEPVICKKEYLNELKSKLMFFFMGTANGSRDSGKILKEQEESNEEHAKRIDDLVLAVDRNYEYLINGEVDKWGEEFNKAWTIKKMFSSSVSNPYIDEAYDKAINAGALGGKILGAGGGGFLLLFVPVEKQDNVRKALSNYEEVKINFESSGSIIIFNE